MKHLDSRDAELLLRGEEGGGQLDAGAEWAGDGSGVGARKIDLSIAYMREHLNQPLQVAKLAALINVSASHYFALFKRRTGCAPIDFFIRLRMRKACRLLGGTSLCVKEVAATLGYEDPFYFSRMFKSVVEVSPSEYRILSQGSDSIHAPGAAPLEGGLSTESPVRISSSSQRKTNAPRANGKLNPRSDATPAFVAAMA